MELYQAWPNRLQDESPNTAKLFVHYILTEEGFKPQMKDGKLPTNIDVKMPADEPSGLLRSLIASSTMTLQPGYPTSKPVKTGRTSGGSTIANKSCDAVVSGCVVPTCSSFNRLLQHDSFLRYR